MSRIIKSSQVNFIKKSIIEPEIQTIQEDIDENLESISEEYEKMIEMAKKQSEDIINDAIKEGSSIKEKVSYEAREEAESIKKEAYDLGFNDGQEEGKSQGYKEGFTKGYDEGKEESDALIKEANDIKRNYLREREEVLNSIEKNVIDLVLDITKKILNQKIDEDDDLIINLVLKGLESLNSREDIRIRVSKEDFDKVEESKEEILSKVSLIENLQVDIDSNLEKGDCIIESSKGSVDVSIDTQIKNVEEELKGLLDSE